jgi:hypothetical protein
LQAKGLNCLKPSNSNVREIKITVCKAQLKHGLYFARIRFLMLQSKKQRVDPCLPFKARCCTDFAREDAKCRYPQE